MAHDPLRQGLFHSTTSLMAAWSLFRLPACNCIARRGTEALYILLQAGDAGRVSVQSVRPAWACGGVAKGVQARAPPVSNAIRVCQALNWVSEGVGEDACLVVHSRGGSHTMQAQQQGECVQFCSIAGPWLCGAPFRASVQMGWYCPGPVRLSDSIACSAVSDSWGMAGHMSAHHVDATCVLHSIGVRRRRAPAWAGPCTAWPQWHTAVWWDGGVGVACLARVHGRGCAPWPHVAGADKCLCASTLDALPRWLMAGSGETVSIRCPLWAQPAYLISSSHLSVLLCQVLMCPVTNKAFNVSAPPACPRVRVRAVLWRLCSAGRR